MMEFFNKSKAILGLFAGDGIVVDLALILLVILLIKEKDKKIRRYILYPSIILLIFIWNPLSVSLFIHSGILIPTRYVRLYWILPISFLIAYVCSKVMVSVKQERRKFIVVLLVVAIIVSGRYMFDSGNFQAISNWYKIPDEVIEVVDIIQEDIEQMGGDVSQVKFIAPVSVCAYARQYNGDMEMQYGRMYYTTDANWSVTEKVKDLLEQSEIDGEKLASYAREGGCNYLVVESAKNQTKKLEDYDYKLIGETETYFIYREDAMNR